jgi:hypothetical protein
MNVVKKDRFGVECSTASIDSPSQIPKSLIQNHLLILVTNGPIKRRDTRVIEK